MTSPTTARKAGSPARSVLDCTSTCSPGWILKPALSSVRAATPLSPLADSASVSCFVPTALPITTAAATNAIQSEIAVQGWRALQRPTFPVMPLLADMPVSLRKRALFRQAQRRRCGGIDPCGRLASAGTENRTCAGVRSARAVRQLARRNVSTASTRR